MTKSEIRKLQKEIEAVKKVVLESMKLSQAAYHSLTMMDSSLRKFRDEKEGE